ncbi:nuclear transport factor 2 family protein [Paenibacillus sp. GCM10012306]|uniref:nuclear transport factor 2 family protein n=1 Tax=Paenibacillus sp. GCM10012306 TaxID=3317342 RepID=UPI003612D63E
MTHRNSNEMQATEIVQAFQNHLVARDFESWFSLFSEDAIFEFPYAPEGYTQRLAGIEEIRNYVNELFKLLNIHSFSKPELIVSDDRIVAEYTCQGEVLGTEKSYYQKYISVIHTRDGKITHFKDYWNPTLLF